MIYLLILAVHLLATIAKLVRPGGVRAVVAESLVLKHQLLISSRARRRAPNLNSFDRFLLGLGSLFVPPSRLPNLAVILKPRTLFRFHEALKKRKYRWLFSSGGHRRPGPKGPSKELIDAIVEFKRRNPRVGCPRIAQQLAHAFGIDINKDFVRRVLAKHYRPEAGTDGPSWLSFIGHVKDSLWSVDLFRCELILLRSHWVMVVMDVFTRRIIGFGVERADPCGVSVCRMFTQIIILPQAVDRMTPGGTIPNAWRSPCASACLSTVAGTRWCASQYSHFGGARASAFFGAGASMPNSLNVRIQLSNGNSAMVILLSAALRRFGRCASTPAS